VIRLGLRLTVTGGREAIGRLVLIVIAVAVGVALLLATVAGLNAVHRQNDRYAWLETGYPGAGASVDQGSAAKQGETTLWWRLRADYFHGSVIGRVDLAAAGPAAPVPPGMAKLPRPGQFYASPALARLLRRTPADQLADRYPGTLAGIIGTAALPSPDELIIVIGHPAAELSGQPGVRPVSRISTTTPGDCTGDCALGVGTNANGLTLILSVVAAALLFPVLILVGGATRLSAARREQRFAAIRLVGATPGQIAVIAVVESLVATVIGIAGGLGLFFAIRPATAQIPFTGERFFVADLALNPADLLIVVLGLPVAAAVVAWLALRRVTISPLGVSRRVALRPPSPWRLLPLLAGIAELAYFAYLRDIGARSHTNTTVEALVFLAGVLLVMAGLVSAGPWFTMLASRLVVRHANRPATLIAARRLADNPQAGFRAVSGLVLAVFIGTCASGIITTIVADNGGTTRFDTAAAATLIDTLAGPEQPTFKAVPAATTSALTAVPGVTGVALIHQASLPGTVPGPAYLPPPVEDLVSCTELARVPALGHCPAGAAAVVINPDFGGFGNRATISRITWHSAPCSAAQLQDLPVASVVVGTASAVAVERARTVLDLALPNEYAAQTIGELRADDARLLDDYRRLAEVVILTSLPIAGCSLAVSVAGGLIERQRPFSQLRLSGTPLRVLRHIVGLEAAAPMLVTAAVSIGAGLLAAQLFLRAQLGETLQPLGVEYYLVIAAGLLASMAVMASILPLLNRLTGPEIARNE